MKKVQNPYLYLKQKIVIVNLPRIVQIYLSVCVSVRPSIILLFILSFILQFSSIILSMSIYCISLPVCLSVHPSFIVLFNLSFILQFVHSFVPFNHQSVYKPDSKKVGTLYKL